MTGKHVNAFRREVDDEFVAYLESLGLSFVHV